MQSKTEIEIKAPKDFTASILFSEPYTRYLIDPAPSQVKHIELNATTVIPNIQHEYESTSFLLQSLISRAISSITPNYCRITDVITTSGLLSNISLTASMSLKALQRISSYQLHLAQKDIEFFSKCSLHQFLEPQKHVLISGASGLIGSALSQLLQAMNFRVTKLVRRPPKNSSEIYWNPEQKELPSKTFDDVDVVINLSGASLSKERWTEKRKEELLRSRILSTKTLVETIINSNRSPELFISMSGANIYPNSSTLDTSTSSTETSQHGSTFLANLATAWEEEALRAEIKCRVVLLRTGAVLSRKGGALPILEKAVRYGFAGKMGSGKQPFPWISLGDILRLIVYTIISPKLSGPINTISPQIPSQELVMKSIGKAILRPSAIPCPSFLARLMFGEIAEELMLHGPILNPEKAIKNGFIFSDIDIQNYLDSELSI